MWQSVEYDNNKLEEIINMTIEYYGKNNDISDQKFLEHEYFENVSGDAFIKLAYDTENKILAGQYVVIPMRMKIGNEINNVILSLNTLTKEQYRGQKIFITLAEEVYAECKEKGYKFCYGAPNPNSHPGFIKRLKFRDAGLMPLFLKIIHPSCLAKEKFESTVLEKIVTPFNLIFHPKYYNTKKAEVVEITSQNVGLFDEFWKRIMNKYQVIGVRDAAYIKWRYIEMPRRDYIIYAAVKRSELIGYIIGRITEVAGMKSGMIVDFLVEDGEKDAGYELLHMLESSFYKNKVGLMGCLMQKHFDEAQILKSFGFFVCPKRIEPQPFPIIYRQFNDMNDNKIMKNFDNWYFTMGDYDVI